nr:transposase, MuDR, MULE transposase domain protein [Tanacetum cinerariifolium]
MDGISLNVDNDPFRPCEDDEEVLGLEVSYLSAIGALMYLTNCTRPDISFAVNLLARGLVGYADAGYLSDPHKARSQTEYMFLNGGTAISWRSSKQTLVATSSNHAEVITLHEASTECVWLRGDNGGDDGVRWQQWCKGKTMMDGVGGGGSGWWCIPFVIDGLEWVESARILARQHVVVLAAMCMIMHCDDSQILNGTFILNELLSWCKYKKVNAMIFKVEFEKAFDSIRWDYLDDVLNSFGFGEKWQSWINSCLSSSMGSVLVNGKWDPSNIKTIMHILKCSYLASGLKINPQKGKLIGIGVNKEEVASTAVIMGKAIQRNLFNGMERSKQKIAWISWDKILESKKYGGLGVSSFYAFNRALLFKWVWRFFLKVHRYGLDSSRLFMVLKDDTWLGEATLKMQYPRLYALELYKDISVVDKMRHPNLYLSFRRQPRGGSEQEQFRDLSSRITDVIIPQIKDRSVWSLDGSNAAHLNGQCKGTNLIPVGMDGNNQIVPIAFGICKGETGPCWSWWMSILKECIGDNPNLLFISDRHATIALAVHNEFSLAYHAVCYHHLMMNLSLKRDKTKALFRKICKAYTTEEFSSSMSHLQDIQLDAYDKLCQVGPQRWSRAHCPLVRYNYLTSNSVESVNACTVVYRKLPVLKLAEMYRAMVQDWYYKSRKLAENMTYEITDWAANKVQKNDKNAKWVVCGVSDHQYQVYDGR